MLRTDDNFTQEQRKGHVVNILSALQMTYSILQDAETGQRGYLITGREEYLSPFESAKTRLTTQLQQLRYLMQDETAYQHQLAQIESLITQKLSELEQTIFLRRTQGFDAARLIVMTHSGKQYMDRIQNFIVKLQASYSHQEKQAQAQINEHRERTLWSVAAILAIARIFHLDGSGAFFLVCRRT